MQLQEKVIKHIRNIYNRQFYIHTIYSFPNIWNTSSRKKNVFSKLDVRNVHNLIFMELLKKPLWKNHNDCSNNKCKVNLYWNYSFYLSLVLGTEWSGISLIAYDCLRTCPETTSLGKCLMEECSFAPSLKKLLMPAIICESSPGAVLG